ncbi:hypothetical protein AB0E96_33400, partial [Kitasatospora sp. NPDC036755]|uniref:hypothetical protein n=1 Tax=Kitasatospora sp. NPDC036755 TaxID=3154600 RepID=UPI0033CB890C
PLVSIEDPLDESDWDGWKAMTDKLGDKGRAAAGLAGAAGLVGGAGAAIARRAGRGGHGISVRRSAARAAGCVGRRKKSAPPRPYGGMSGGPHREVRAPASR